MLYIAIIENHNTSPLLPTPWKFSTNATNGNTLHIKRGSWHNMIKIHMPWSKHKGYAITSSKVGIDLQHNGKVKQRQNLPVINPNPTLSVHLVHPEPVSPPPIKTKPFSLLPPSKAAR
jgi:hypothetical protein